MKENIVLTKNALKKFYETPFEVRLWNGEGWDVWNMHPLRKSWQHVYSLSSCVPRKHVVQSIKSLKRLFEKE